MTYFAALLAPTIQIVEAQLIGEAPDLMADEALYIARAVPQRRLEFAMGRKCARIAMEALGHAPAPLLTGPDRMPIWPNDLVGSITHTRAWVAAAVARRDDGIAAVGIDLEPANELSADLWALICMPEEQAKLAAIGGMTLGLAAHLLFCMKEAAFKCQFPLSRAMLEFADLAIDVDVEAGMYSATFRKIVPPFHAGDRLVGRFALTDDHIASAVILTSERAP